MSRRRYARLDELDGDHRDDFDVGSGSFDAGAGTMRRLRGGSAQELPTLGGAFGCWCGGEYGHDWPGKVDGKPHPR